MPVSVHKLPTTTLLPLKPDDLLDANKGSFPHLLILIGYDEEGRLITASSTSDAGDMLIMIEKAKRRVFEYCIADEATS